MSDRETQPGSIIPGVDWESGVKRLMGNEQLYRKLLAKFAASYGDAAGRIRDALSAGDRQTAHNELHTLKGVTANLSLAPLPIWSLRRNRPSSTTIRNTKTNVSTP